MSSALLLLAIAAQFREVPVRVEPPQRVTALVLQSNGGSVPISVADGKAKVPEDLPLPWKVSQLRFEPATYTQADLDAHRPLILRELGRLAGTVREGGRPISHEFVLTLRGNGSSEVEERTFSGAFETALPAGVYQAVIASDSCGTRLRVRDRHHTRRADGPRHDHRVPTCVRHSRGLWTTSIPHSLKLRMMLG